MLTKKNDRNVQRLNTESAVTSTFHKKGNLPRLIPRLKPGHSNKPKQESFATPAPRLTNKKHHNCFPPSEGPWKSTKISSSLKMKSVSLVDIASEEKLRLKVPRISVSREQGDMKSTAILEKRIHSLFNGNGIFNVTSARENELAKHVGFKFILYAWRKQRTQTKNLQFISNSLSKEMDNLKLQTCLLKALVESDHKRAILSTNEINQAKKKLQEEIETSKVLTEQLNKREVSFSEDKLLWHSMKKQMEERIESLTTELDKTVKNSLLLNEKALRYKQQLQDARKSEVSLKDKLEVLEDSLEAKVNEMNNIRNKCFDLQKTVEGLVTRNQELAREKEKKEKQICEYVNNLKNLEVEIQNFQNIKKVQCSDFVKLRNDYDELNKQITSKDLEIRGLNETVKLYETKEKQIQTQIKNITHRVFQLTLNLIPLSDYIPF